MRHKFKWATILGLFVVGVSSTTATGFVGGVDVRVNQEAEVRSDIKCTTRIEGSDLRVKIRCVEITQPTRQRAPLVNGKREYIPSEELNRKLKEEDDVCYAFCD